MAHPMLKAVAGSALALAFSTLGSIVHAQEGKTILVLDASGSMWQEIADGYKIRIAQDVINGLLDTLPSEQELGLITYGHRQKGDCGDIELMVPPGADTRRAISEAVDSLNPTGKTPLSAAVIQAADELNIEQNPATVILVSDGRETCDLDPCAVGSELEDRGIDFTAHVIGFDIDEEQDREQLRCLAENTGGKFLTASTASELTEALVTVSQPVEQLRLLASAIDDEKDAIEEGLIWSLVPSSSDISIVPDEQQNADSLTLEIEAGQYTLSVTREQDGASASLDIDAQSDQSNEFILGLPSLPLLASLHAPESGPQATAILVEWSGPDQQLDYIAIARQGEDEAISLTRTADGSPLELHMPPQIGDYEIRYVQDKNKQTLATLPISVVDANISINSDETAGISSDLSVSWTGPDEQYDHIAVAEIGSDTFINISGTDDGSPLDLKMPGTPGEYELRYVSNKFKTTLATRLITVKEVEATLNAPDEADAGASIDIEWTGPDAAHDYITIGEIGKTTRYDLSATSRGSPLALRMPPQPGEYELRYILKQGKKILATRRIKVNRIEVSLNAPDEAVAGESVSIEWIGPDAVNDVIAVAEIGERRTINRTYTKRGNPLTVEMPDVPGNYEIRYVLRQGRTTLATRPITVTDQPAE